ncbi:MAG: hypothetical protein ABI338_01330 [Gemmatimonadaceae bacterium]
MKIFMEIRRVPAILGIAVAAALLVSAPAASAQRLGGHRGGGMRPPPPVKQPVTPRRQVLEKQFRQQTEAVVKEKLHLNDDQVSRLRSVNANIGAQRNSLLQQERSVRSDLRDEMAKGSTADQSKVSQLMAQAHDLQGKRFELQQDEQQQLSGFMTPVQVAQYVGLQAQIRQYIRQQKQGGEPDVPNP